MLMFLLTGAAVHEIIPHVMTWYKPEISMSETLPWHGETDDSCKDHPFRYLLLRSSVMATQ